MNTPEPFHAALRAAIDCHDLRETPANACSVLNKGVLAQRHDGLLLKLADSVLGA